MAEKLLGSGDWVYALFFFHLSLEKLFRVQWVKENVDNFPPRIQDIQSLCNQTTFEPYAETCSYLAIVTTWNLETRYPDFYRRIFQRTNKDFAMEQYRKTEKIWASRLDKLSTDK